MTATRSIEAAERRARLAVRHHLADAHRSDDVVQMVDDLVALHATDPVTVHLSAALRLRQPSLEPLSKALYDERKLIRHHAMRRTLWVFGTDVARCAHASTTQGLINQQRRQLVALLEHSDEVPDAEAWIRSATEEILTALARLGPTSARELGVAVPALTTKLRLAAGKSYGADVSAHTRLLLLLGFEGRILRTRPTGSWISGEYRWALAEDWLDGGLAVGATELTGSSAAAALARRWLRAFGPASLADLQWWTGWSAGVTKAALGAAGATAVDLDGQPGWALDDDLERVEEPEPWVALLPGLDPTTMGWKERRWYLSPDVAAAVFDRNGNGGPTIWADGRIVGGWVQRPSGDIAVSLLVDVGSEQRAAIDTAAADLQVLLGPTRFKVRFPAPMQADLLA